ncbi:MAG: eukaryotic-like serine/threonine-protein kinase, partial [Candidatus Eremiobacteraeota bacterium]|nr:eukaryotic-like serine/threonine-protein kinase [Candidatus Eremiobacteraeota bacterium]
RSPLDLVLTDFGIASVLDQASRRFTAGHRTVAYAAPETAAGEVSPAADWWSAGIILVEVLTGRHPFVGAQPGELLDERVIMSRLAQMSVDDLASGVEGRRRDLCRGLLRRDAKHRWGFAEIERWRRNDPTLIVPAEQTPGRYGLVPFFFAGSTYESLPQIAAAFDANWSEARKSVERGHLLDWVKDELKDNEWRQFLGDLDRDCKDLDERVFRICVKLDPDATAGFCGYPLDPAGLERLAHDALAGAGGAVKVVAALLAREILPLAAAQTGIVRYRELHAAWTSALRECDAMRESVSAAGGPSPNHDRYRDAPAAMLFASMSAGYVQMLRAQANAVATGDALECRWFRALGDPLGASAAAAFIMSATEAEAHAAGREERLRRAAEQRAALSKFASQAAVVAGIIVAIAGFSWLVIANQHTTGNGYSGGVYSSYPAPNAAAGGGAGAGTTGTAAAAQPAMTGAASVALVNEYYRLWNNRDFSTMYTMLGERMQRKNPYDLYLKYHSLVTRIDVDVTQTSDPAVVHVRIVSRDREKDGRITENVNEGQWFLEIEKGGLKLSGQDVHDVTPAGTNASSAALSSAASTYATAARAAANVSATQGSNLISRYYTLWNSGAYATMYDMLSARMRRAHPYDVYAHYHANVVSIGVDVTPTSDPLAFDVRIVSRDREKDGSVTENVSVGTWHLAWENGELKLDAEDIREAK